jgi:hypothetical protein
MPFKVAEHSPFILMAEDWFAPPAGFPTHPHCGIETVTFVLAGELLHEDHTGGKGWLGPDEAQFMTPPEGEVAGPKNVSSLSSQSGRSSQPIRCRLSGLRGGNRESETRSRLSHDRMP